MSSAYVVVKFPDALDAWAFVRRMAEEGVVLATANQHGNVEWGCTTATAVGDPTWSCPIDD